MWLKLNQKYRWDVWNRRGSTLGLHLAANSHHCSVLWFLEEDSPSRCRSSYDSQLPRNCSVRDTVLGKAVFEVRLGLGLPTAKNWFHWQHRGVYASSGFDACVYLQQGETWQDQKGHTFRQVQNRMPKFWQSPFFPRRRQNADYFM